MAGGGPSTSSKLEQAQFLVHAGELERARVIVARLVERSPRDVEANAAMAHVLTLMDRTAQAAHFARRALAARPGEAELQLRLGSLLNSLGETEEGAELLARAVDGSAAGLAPHNNLVFALLARRRFGEAAERCRAGLERFPDEEQLLVKLSAALLGAGRAEEAAAEMRAAAERLPENSEVAKALATTLNYVGDAPAERVLAAHAEYGKRLERELAAAGMTARAAHRNAPDPERRLRVGIVSADLRRHSVAHFAEPMLRHLDRGGFEVVCYNTGGPGDLESERLKGLADGWREVWALGPAELAGAIEGDGVDIAMELSGLSHAERLGAMALRPAPVQVSCVGYPNTTGVRGIGWRIVDSLTDPEGAGDALAVERLARIDPCFLCYQPPGAGVVPEIDGRAGAEGVVTYGSFNALSKLNGRTAALWARVLRETPGSRLLLKSGGLGEERVREEIAARFGALGAARERLELVAATTGFREHLEMYSRVDVALDTSPYHGTTTTCEAMLMGTPVVSLVGDVHAARVGLSLLTSVGLGELATGSEDEFVRMATALGRDAGRRAELRATLRARMLGSALCDGAAYGARLGAALRGMWREWCESGARA